MRRTKLSLLIILFTAPALAQVEDGTYLLVSSNRVSPATATTTIEVWATWTDPRVEWIFGAGDYDLRVFSRIPSTCSTGLVHRPA